MAINFPSSPNPGDIYTYNGYIWEYVSGGYWKSVTESDYIYSASSVGNGTSVISGITGGNLYLKSFSGNNISISESNGTLTFSAGTTTTSTGNFLSLSGGTVTGATNYTAGLSANTISATTYNNLPQYSAGLLNNSNSWVNNNNGTITLPSSNVALFNQLTYPNTINVYTITSGTSGTQLPSLSDNDTNYIVVDYSGGTPSWNILTDNSTIDGETIVLTHIVYRAGNFLHVLDFGNQGVALPNKLNDRVVAVDRFARESGFSLGLSGSTGVVTLTSGIAWNGTNRQSLVAVNSQDDVFFQSFHSGGTWVYTTTANTINNQYYDNGTNRVVATGGKYLVNWYFRGQEINDHLYEVWGTDEYDNVADAQLSVEPSLPELVTSHAFLTGRIIILVGASTGLTESAFVQVFQSTQVTQHNDLTSIQGGSSGQYYHLDSTQYNNLALTNLSNTFTTNQTINGNLTITGNTTSNGDVTGFSLVSSQSVGDEGGEIRLAKAQTNTTLSGSTITIDIYQNRLRFFETSSPNRGAYIDLSAASSGVGSNLLSGGTSSSVNLGLVYTTANNLNLI